MLNNLKFGIIVLESKKKDESMFTVQEINELLAAYGRRDITFMLGWVELLKSRGMDGEYDRDIKLLERKIKKWRNT